MAARAGRWSRVGIYLVVGLLIQAAALQLLDQRAIAILLSVVGAGAVLRALVEIRRLLPPRQPAASRRAQPGIRPVGALSESQRRIVALLATRPGPLTTPDLAAALGVADADVDVQLADLRRQRAIARSPRGYALTRRRVSQG